MISRGEADIKLGDSAEQVLSEGVERTAPEAGEYLSLRQAVGWPRVSLDSVREAFKQTIFFSCVRSTHQLIAFGRIVGDHSLYFYIQDVMVEPQLQRRGYGRAVVMDLLNQAKSCAGRGAFLGLLAVSGTESFYSRLALPSLAHENTPMGIYITKDLTRSSVVQVPNRRLRSA
jgi:GNAT superfamily N-acetyltransferase